MKKKFSNKKLNLEYFLKEYLKERPIFLSLIRAKEAELFQKYLPFKTPVLDLGCGDGIFAKIILSGSNDKIIDVGLDIKDSRIAEAQEMAIYKKTVIYNGKTIPYPANYFGTVISNCVLEHIPDLNNTIKEIHRVLKPKGIFITTVATNNWEKYLFGSLIFGKFYKKWMRNKQKHFNILTYTEWENVFLNYGFKILNEIGYLDRTSVRWIDILHYFSLSSLVSYRLFHKWVIWKSKFDNLNIEFISNLIKKDLPKHAGGNIFYSLIKS